MVPKVPYSDKWMAKFQKEIGGLPTTSENDVSQIVEISATEESAKISHLESPDWSYTTDYCLSVSVDKTVKDVFRAREFQPQQTKDNITVIPQTTNGIDFNMLQRRDIPILFYDEFTLYEV